MFISFGKEEASCISASGELYTKGSLCRCREVKHYVVMSLNLNASFQVTIERKKRKKSLQSIKKEQ